MYWELHIHPVDESPACLSWDGRYVAHRHNDAFGPHVDLRIEQGDVLLGWRIDGPTLAQGAWATEKGPHPLHWLAPGAGPERIDAGHYRWEERSDTRRGLLLEGRDGLVRVCFEPAVALAPGEIRALVGCLRETHTPPEAVPVLLRDGITARTRAIARLCGLGSELDGPAFDTATWHNMLDGLSLDEIHAQLRAFEARFDAKYPPEPTSRPEPLPVEEGRRDPRAWEILRDNPA